MKQDGKPLSCEAAKRGEGSRGKQNENLPHFASFYVSFWGKSAQINGSTLNSWPPMGKTAGCFRGFIECTDCGMWGTNAGNERGNSWKQVISDISDKVKSNIYLNLNIFYHSTILMR